MENIQTMVKFRTQYINRFDFLKTANTHSNNEFSHWFIIVSLNQIILLIFELKSKE